MANETKFMKRKIVMKRIMLSLIVIVASLQSFSQTGRISGQVINSDTKETIPYANVTLYNSSDFSLISGLVSNEDGDFDLKKVAYGNYSLLVSFIGFDTDTSNIDLTSQSSIASLGTISLSPSKFALDEVEVTAIASTSISKIDRKTYRVEDFATARGGNAADVLNKLPSVSVDPDGIVSVRGTSDFMVYINGKPSQIDPSMLLSQISGDMIKKIDVITVPTARFDAQGKGGIINITTKTAGQKGLSISVNGLGGGAPWGHKTDTYSAYKMNDNRYGGGASISYVKNKLAVYGGLNYNMRNINGLRTGDARLLQSDGSYYHMLAQGERPEWFENSSLNTGFDYQLSDKSTLTGSYYYGKRREGRSAFYIYNNFFGDVNKNEIEGVPVNEDWVYNPNTDNRYGVFHTASLDFTHELQGNDELSLSLLYENSGLSRILSNQNFDYNPETDQAGLIEAHFIQTDDTPLQAYRFSAEYLKNIGDNHSVRVGLQPQIFNITGSFNYDTLSVVNDTWASYSSLSNSINLDRGIYAGFVDYQGSYGNLDVAAGVRFEYTDQTMEIENPDYFSIFERETRDTYTVKQPNWFPSLHLLYNISESSSVQLATSKRISRPPIKNMAPFLYRRHYEVYVVGDPALKPEYLSNVELSYNQKFGKQSINLTGFYRGTDNAIFRVNTVFEEENVLIRSYTNSGNTQAAGAELNANFQLGTVAKLFLGGSLYNYRIEADIFGYQEDNNSLNWSLKSNFVLFLSKEFNFTADFDLKSATVTAQGENALFFFSNLALEYNPQKLKGWVFSARGLDILGSNQKGLNTRAYDQTGVQVFYQATEYRRYGPIVELQATYSLNWKNKKTGGSEFGKKEF